ncbi:phosphatidylcholine synthase [Azospirillum sp. TSO22-1]|uniref:CDP-alcohol phosphatidyltransferase family protein n=1 Tax=Azospirillum sp. TSO22-1 TaxID=716789 RepID=UPI000D61C00F|nr:phosphatidylcholine synthase [Azospirillum sp. TSO22-1]PWC54608.1 phosphatidylcholine synthase [Azospirillum sp. TSO22-1]
MPSRAVPAGRRLAAWAVHGFTAFGAVLGFAALMAAGQGEAAACFAFLGLALVVDGVDGTFARSLRVKEALPGIDGAVLDLVIDYLTYVLVPAVFVVWFDLLPRGLAMPAAAWMLVTSLYCFANTGMKSADHYFVGFPAIWNVVVLCLWLLRLGPTVNAAVIAALGVLTFIPVKFLHPLRVRALLPLNALATAAWLVSAAWLVAIHPERPVLPFVVWLAAGAYYVGVSAWRTVRGAA